MILVVGGLFDCGDCLFVEGNLCNCLLGCILCWFVVDWFVVYYVWCVGCLI